MKPEPVWRSARREQFPKLTKSSRFDVVVIGGGITGVTAAYLLKEAGKRVCLLERDRLGFVDTGLTTAHLTYVTDLRIAQLAKRFGDQAATAVLRAGAVAIDTIESIAQDERIDCEFRRVPGFLCSPFGLKKNDAKSLQQDAETAQRLGFSARFVDSVPYFKGAGVQFADQAKFHPLKYLFGLAAAVQGDGSTIYEQTEVSEIEDDPLRVVAGRIKIETDYVVIATHNPLMGKSGAISAGLFQSKLFPYTSYAIGAKIPRGLLWEASFWDTSNPYYYLRVEAGEKSDYAIFGGEDHKTGQETDTEKRFERLCDKLLDLIPQARPDRQWSGQVIETPDGLPYIGETATKQFVATGFSGNGMTFGTIAGLMARDAVLGKENPWQKLFNVGRKKIRGGAWNYLTENLDYPYYYLADRLARPAETPVNAFQPGEGQIIQIDGQRAACSRDRDGKLHTVSAYCTHMGCLVRFNGAEQTWDCPCHGSRFRANGEVLAGPAESPLEPIAGKKTPGKPRQPAEKGRTNRANPAKRATGKNKPTASKPAAKTKPTSSVKSTAIKSAAKTTAAKKTSGRNRKSTRRNSGAGRKGR